MTDRPRRVAIQQRISELADERLCGVDPSVCPVTEAARFNVLDAEMWLLKRCLEHGDDHYDALLALAAETHLWLEALERNRAR